MAESRADDIIRMQEQMRGLRGPWETLWQDVADRVWPQMSDFVSKRQPGEKRTEKIFDATACLALEKFAAAIHSLISPDNQVYQKLSPKDKTLREFHPLMRYLDDVTEVLFAVRRSPFANFSSQANECYKSLGAFGTLGMMVEDVLGRGIRYKSCHLGELFIAENEHGRIDTVHRRFEYTARQAAGAFGPDVLPEKAKQALEKGDENSKFEFIHSVRPNRSRKHGRMDAAGMAFKSCYVSIEGRQVVSEGGYRTFPYAISRYSTNPREVYGRGPAMMVLPDIKMINEMEKTTLRAGHLAVDPPLLLLEDGSLHSFQMRPRALNYGGIDDQGRQLVQPLKTDANLPWAMEMAEGKRKTINEAFLVTLFQILVETPQITATEALLRAQEKGQLLAPTMGRQQSEFLGQITERELDILAMAGVLPEPPPEVAELIDAGEIEIEYTSPLSRLMRSEDGVAIMRTFEQLAPMAQVDPTVFDVFDTEALPRELAEINGVPAKVLRGAEQVAALRETRRQQQQAQAMLEAAPVAADAANSLAQAAATASQIQQTGAVAA
jgi:hypothetical protein